jgi:hypothetical protein
MSNGVLCLAARSANVERVDALLDAGAIVDFTDKRGYTPLMCACENTSTVESARMLVDAGANVNFTTVGAYWVDSCGILLHRLDVCPGGVDGGRVRDGGGGGGGMATPTPCMCLANDRIVLLCAVPIPCTTARPWHHCVAHCMQRGAREDGCVLAEEGRQSTGC